MLVRRAAVFGVAMLPVMGAAQAEPYATSQPSNKFLVFLGCDSTELSPKAREVVVQAVARAKRWGTKRVLVTGFTDALRSDDISKELSERMAKSVHAEIVKAGIPTRSFTSAVPEKPRH